MGKTQLNQLSFAIMKRSIYKLKTKLFLRVHVSISTLLIPPMIYLLTHRLRKLIQKYLQEN